MSHPSALMGRPVRVATNTFAITQLPRKPFYHYDAIFKKDFEGLKACPRHRCAEIIDRLQKSMPETFVRDACYDGFKNLFCSYLISDGTYTVRTIPTNPNKGVFEVKITKVGTINTVDLMRFTTQAGAAEVGGAQSTIAVTLLQVIVSQAPHIAHNFSLHAKSFYNKNNSFPLSPGLQGWKGFFQSVRPVLNRFIINVDTTAAAFYETGNLLNVACGVAGFRDKRSFIRAMNDTGDDKVFRRVRAFFKGVVVTIRPSGARKKISGIVRRAGATEFESTRGTISIAEYWYEHHHLPLHEPEAFGIKGNGDAVFPAEVCEIVPGQRYTKKLSPRDTDTFIQKTKSRPDARLRDIETAVRGETLGYLNSPYMQEAGVQVSTRPIEVNARLLPAPTIQFQNGPVQLGIKGSWNVMRQRLHAPQRVMALAVVIFDDENLGYGHTATEQDASITRQEQVEALKKARTEDERRRIMDAQAFQRAADLNATKRIVQTFTNALVKNMRDLGMEFHPKFVPYYEMGRKNDVNQSMMKAWGRIGDQFGPWIKNGEPVKMYGINKLPCPPTFFLVLLPANAADTRKEVKHFGDVKWGIPTQCVRAGKYDQMNARGLDQYCNNIALKINAKLGGTNSTVACPTPNVQLLLSNAMFVGCDVSHPGPGVWDRPSVASLVASTDEAATQYQVFARAQPPREELIADIAVMLKEAIEVYARKRGPPKGIVLFRDGVSEGEYEKVETGEVQIIEAMLEKFYQKRIQLVFIVVGKRHHIRLFPTNPADSDKSGNCLPGTVVDTEIVHSKYMDFYLLSHSGLVGTSRPSHYVVLRNQPGFNANVLQELSYALCHVYATATRSVSIPAPVYYADRVCARVSDFQFKDEMYEDTSTEGGSGKRPPFPIQEWQNALQHSLLANQMYFL